MVNHLTDFVKKIIWTYIYDEEIVYEILSI